MWLINISLFRRKNLITLSLVCFSSKPTSAEVLTSYLSQCNEPPWTSYFVKYSSVKDNQFGMSNFNWKVGRSNYQILRTGCYPYIKYHCSRKEAENLDASDRFMRVIKVVNFGIPCLLYGLAATQLIRHSEVVQTSKGPVTIYFLLPEDKGSIY
ncbi:jg12283 [Pararge aegeria aegeria]|uniref:Jg12283 protein n=2 Tax=Pararge aegeria TaxID=116150 RepID=A0A8S4SN99_9NEOP|nr:jg12283 [Pararge aegeria aegeria]